MKTFRQLLNQLEGTDPLCKDAEYSRDRGPGAFETPQELRRREQEAERARRKANLKQIDRGYKKHWGVKESFEPDPFFVSLRKGLGPIVKKTISRGGTQLADDDAVSLAKHVHEMVSGHSWDDLPLREKMSKVALVHTEFGSIAKKMRTESIDDDKAGLNRARNMMSVGAVLNHKQQTGPRSLSAIAREIRKDWKKVYFGAVPYLDAMSSLDSINDQYYQDSAKSVVAYFLSNATSWRGDTARRIKKELNDMLKSAKGRW